MKTYSPKPTEIKRTWYLVDAKGQTLGRLASQLAVILQGKQKPGYAPHLDLSDYVIVVNAAAIKVTGNKLAAKKYYHHSGYPGGIKEVGLGDKLKQDPAWVIHHAVKGMLPKNRLTDDRLSHLKIYAGSEHPHGPQQPQELTLGKERA